jgi:hypothetical protein
MSDAPRSVVVKMLADIASQGTYQVNPDGARKMNAVFAEVAKLINEMEAEEATDGEAE